jgi:radical SAM-linked protein
MPLVGGEAASGDSPDSGAEEPVARASELPEETEEPHAPEEEQEGRWYVFSFQKTGKASYLSHINIMNIFTRALQRAGLSAEFTRGFNPKPRIEFAQPLALGISSEAEIGRVKLIGIDPEEPDEEGMIERINAKMPSGIRLTVLRECAGRAREGRGVSLMPYFGGASFRITPLGVHRDTAVESRSSLLQAARAYGLDESQVYSGGEEGELVFEVPATGEKAYKLKEFVRSYTEFPDFLSRFHVHRTALWTRSEEVTVKDPMSYIELFTRAADGNA